jgi:hypothetical protein
MAKEQRKSGYFRMKNLDKFQHYKYRGPLWMKLYQSILDDYEFTQLPDPDKAHLILLWLLASRRGNKLPFDVAWIQQHISATHPVNLQLLEQLGFVEPIEDASDYPHIVASNYREGLLEQSRVEKSRVEKSRSKPHVANATVDASAPTGREPTWLQVVGAVWIEHHGAGSFPWPKAGKLLKPLEVHPAAEVADHLRNYIASGDARYRNLAKFVETYAEYARRSDPIGTFQRPDGKVSLAERAYMNARMSVGLPARPDEEES